MTTWRCGHPKTPENTYCGVQCALCHRARMINYNAEKPRKGTLTLGKKIALGIIK